MFETEDYPPKNIPVIHFEQVLFFLFISFCQKLIRSPFFFFQPASDERGEETGEEHRSRERGSASPSNPRVLFPQGYDLLFKSVNEKPEC